MACQDSCRGMRASKAWLFKTCCYEACCRVRSLNFVNQTYKSKRPGSGDDRNGRLQSIASPHNNSSSTAQNSELPYAWAPPSLEGETSVCITSNVTPGPSRDTIESSSSKVQHRCLLRLFRVFRLFPPHLTIHPSYGGRYPRGPRLSLLHPL